MTQPPLYTFQIPNAPIHPPRPGQHDHHQFPFTPNELLAKFEKLLEAFLRHVVMAITGFFLHGIPSADQLRAWAQQLVSEVEQQALNWAKLLEANLGSDFDHTIEKFVKLFEELAALLNHFEAALHLVGVTNAEDLIKEFRGLIPAALPQFNGTALANDVQGFAENFNGTVSYTVQQGVNDIGHVFEQADGTIISAAHAAIQAAQAAAAVEAQNVASAVAAGQQAIDHAIGALVGQPIVQETITTAESLLPGAVRQLGNRAHIFGGLFSQHLTTVYNGLTGGSAPVASASDVASATQQVSDRQAAAQRQLASINSQIPHFYGGSGAAGNAYAVTGFGGGLPASFTAITTQQALYNAGVAATDQQTVSAVWTNVLNGDQTRFLILRSNTAATTFVYAKFWLAGNSGHEGVFYLELGCYVAGVNAPLANYSFPLWNYHPDSGMWTIADGYRYWLATGNGLITFEATDYTLKFTQNTGLSAIYVDWSHITQKGSSYRSAGYVDSAGLPGYLLSWDFYDSGPTQGPSTAIVSTTEATISTGWTDLATTTDQVTVNIGTSGLALVSISAVGYSTSASIIGYVSFEVNGATYQPASDLTCAFASESVSSYWENYSWCHIVPNLNAGATTFKMKYKIYSAGDYQYFANRRITVVPL